MILPGFPTMFKPITSFVGIPVIEFLTSGSTWDVPSGVTMISKVRCIGSGGSGYVSDTANGKSGGGGGAYSEITDLAVTPGASISYQVGATSTDTWFGSTATVLAKAGANGFTTTGGAGGAAGDSVGSVKYSGGAGGSSSAGGGGGGGSAGPDGDGQAGGSCTTAGGGGGGGSNGGSSTAGGNSSGTNGGSGGHGNSGTGGGAAGDNGVDASAGVDGGGGAGGKGGNSTTGTDKYGAHGGSQSLWQDSDTLTWAGPGGGGGGGSNSTSGSPNRSRGGNGGGYGSGGGAGRVSGGSAAGPGLIVIEYTATGGGGGGGGGDSISLTAGDFLTALQGYSREESAFGFNMGSISEEPVPTEILLVLTTSLSSPSYNIMGFMGDHTSKTATLVVNGESWTLGSPFSEAGDTYWEITPPSSDHYFVDSITYDVEITLT